MVGVVSLIPSGGNFIFADFETLWCQFCTKMPDMSDLCYLGKTSSETQYVTPVYIVDIVCLQSLLRSNIIQCAIYKGLSEPQVSHLVFLF